MNTDKPEEITLSPPCRERIAKRALVLGALACRGVIEWDASEPQAEDLRAEIVEWLERCGAEAEAEPQERNVLRQPLGNLWQQEHADVTWQAEGMAVLAWALRRAELPDYEQCADPKSVADSMGWLSEDVVSLINNAEVRPLVELEVLADKLFALDWRLAHFTLNKKPLNFEEFAKTAWFGPLNVDGLRFAGGDLSVGSVPLSEADEKARAMCRLITVNRRRAAEWLLGRHEVYSDIDLST